VGAAGARRQQTSVDPLTILAVLGLGTLAVGAAFSAAGLSRATALLFGLLFLIPALLNLPLAIVLWVPLTFLPPLAFLGVAPTAAACVLLLAWLPTMRSSAGAATLFRLHGGRLLVMLVFLIWVTLSVSWARVPENGIGQLWQWWLAGGLFLVAVTTISTPRQARMFVALLVVGGVLSALVGLLGESLSSSASALELASEDRRRLGSILGDPNYVAAGMVACVVLATGLLRARHSFANAWVLAAIAFLTVSFAATESRGALVAAAVAALAALVFYRGRRAQVVIVLAALVSVAALWFSVNPNAWQRISEFDATGTGRTALWQVAWRMTEDHPVGGVGLKNFVEEAPKYTREPGKLEAVTLIAEQPHVAHNVYLQFLAETGFVGLVLFLALLLSSMAAAWRGARAFEALGNGDMAALSRACLVGLIAFASASFFISDGNDVRFWLLMALGPIMYGVAVRSAAPTQASLESRRRSRTRRLGSPQPIGRSVPTGG
jgi:O-antigen ligase